MKKALLKAVKRMAADGLTHGTSGNVSVRMKHGFLVTPSGMPYGKMKAKDLVEVRWDGSVPRGQREPSSEWQMHRDVYAQRQDVSAIFHLHSMFATTISCLRKAIPAVHYMIAVANTTLVRCAEYATFGTYELSAAAVAALHESKACLLANHGLLAVGTSLPDAYRVATEIENLAEQYWRALQAGEPVILDDAEMARVIEKFKTYGRRD